MIILGLESTCDETAASVVSNGCDVLSNVIASQIDLHNLYGGVIPELACRRHSETILPVTQKALQDAKIDLTKIDAIAVAQGPGLIGALLVGIQFAKGLAYRLKKPLIGINHIEAHLYASIMNHMKAPIFPAIGVVVSGAHTAILKIEAIGQYELIGSTVDDAIGEAFDKVAKILGLSYPGGPVIEVLAKKGDPSAYPFKGGTVKTHPYYFSYSGLKTAVFYAIQKITSQTQTPFELTDAQKQDIAASFQKAAFQDVIQKTKKACAEFCPNALVIGGGVAQNNYFQKELQKEISSIPIFFPSKEMSSDNAAMIAGLGFYKTQIHFEKGIETLFPYTRDPNLISSLGLK